MNTTSPSLLPNWKSVILSLESMKNRSAPALPVTLADADFTSTPAIDKDGKPIRATRKYFGEIGKTLAKVDGTTACYRLTGKELYVRTTITSDKPHVDLSFPDQHQQAWVQSVGFSLP